MTRRETKCNNHEIKTEALQSLRVMLLICQENNSWKENRNTAKVSTLQEKCNERQLNVPYCACKDARK